MTRIRNLLLAAALLAAPAATGEAVCRTDRLGNTICRGAEPAPAERRPSPLVPAEDPTPPAFIPGWRENVFGTVRPRRPALPRAGAFGEAPRPAPPVRCTRDSFGSVHCR